MLHGGVARGWKYELAEIVASNFRCKHFFYGKQAAVFYGHKTDVQVAKEIYTFLFKNGDKLANKLVYKTIRDAKKAGMRNNGFSNGAYSEGVKAGKSAMASRAIEG